MNDWSFALGTIFGLMMFFITFLMFNPFKSRDRIIKLLSAECDMIDADNDRLVETIIKIISQYKISKDLLYWMYDNTMLADTISLNDKLEEVEEFIKDNENLKKYKIFVTAGVDESTVDVHVVIDDHKITDLGEIRKIVQDDLESHPLPFKNINVMVYHPYMIYMYRKDIYQNMNVGDQIICEQDVITHAPLTGVDLPKYIDELKAVLPFKFKLIIRNDLNSFHLTVVFSNDDRYKREDEVFDRVFAFEKKYKREVCMLFLTEKEAKEHYPEQEYVQGDPLKDE